jgi:hypothetical protein
VVVVSAPIDEVVGAVATGRAGRVEQPTPRRWVDPLSELSLPQSGSTLISRQLLGVAGGIEFRLTRVEEHRDEFDGHRHHPTIGGSPWT